MHSSTSISGLAKSDDFRKNPRKVWYFNVAEITTGGDFEVTFHLKAPQTVVPWHSWRRATRLSAPRHVRSVDAALTADRHGPFKVSEFSAARRSRS